MRIAVECGGFAQAADAARTANQVAALVGDTLSGKLAGLAGMAGDDSTSAEFAGAYDAGAREAVAALADLTHAFIGLGRLLTATGSHHARAEASAAGQVLASVSAGLTSDTFVRVRPAPPPSSLGAQEPSFGAVDRWILDHVQGFVWPSGDVSMLRDAATAWRRASESVAGLVDHVASARAFVEVQRSPEVPVALSCLDDVRDLVLATADELAALGAACDDHAAAVEGVHERTRALLEEVASMVVEGVAVSAVVGAITGPLGGGVAAGALMNRIRQVAPRFHALLVTLRVSVVSCSTRLRTGRETLAGLRTRLVRYSRTRVRDERGAVRMPWGGRWEKGWLRRHEVPPGHTLDRHVGKTVDELAERCRTGRPRRASSFDDQDAAERLLEDVLRRRGGDIRDWLRNNEHRLTLVEEMGVRTGTTVGSDGVVSHPTGIRVVLIADDACPSGWRILTAFPN
ncbi:RNase A-like domain-containing protein [Nocardioides zeicaulis]|uniref:RNase A-like domain-containing protein n=1 Tax=Nocardioides zeicaulis TaxID=1776857 RepID=A0ABV6DZD5_9ACTN